MTNSSFSGSTGGVGGTCRTQKTEDGVQAGASVKPGGHTAGRSLAYGVAWPQGRCNSRQQEGWAGLRQGRRTAGAHAMQGQQPSGAGSCAGTAEAARADAPWQLPFTIVSSSVHQKCSSGSGPQPAVHPDNQKCHNCRRGAPSAAAPSGPGACCRQSACAACPLPPQPGRSETKEQAAAIGGPGGRHGRRQRRCRSPPPPPAQRPATMRQPGCVHCLAPITPHLQLPPAAAWLRAAEGGHRWPAPREGGGPALGDNIVSESPGR